jgi:hypothetical protein
MPDLENQANLLIGESSKGIRNTLLIGVNEFPSISPKLFTL